jgi:hypothetical protein
MFIMRVGHTKKLVQHFEIVVELAHKTARDTAMNERLVEHVVRTLCSVNIEYGKLYSALGARARPDIIFVRYGELETIPGRKHRWVKR